MKISKSFLTIMIMCSISIGLISGLFIARTSVTGIMEEVETKTRLFSEPVEIITNLSFEKGKENHYIKSKICVSTYDESALEILNGSSTVLNDIYMNYFNKISYDKLSTNGYNRKQMKKDLATTISFKLNIEVEDVIFSEFLYQ